MKLPVSPGCVDSWQLCMQEGEEPALHVQVPIGWGLHSAGQAGRGSSKQAATCAQQCDQDAQASRPLYPTVTFGPHCSPHARPYPHSPGFTKVVLGGSERQCDTHSRSTGAFEGARLPVSTVRSLTWLCWAQVGFLIKSRKQKKQWLISQNRTFDFFLWRQKKRRT